MKCKNPNLIFLYGQIDPPKAICPLNFFKVGGITKPCPGSNVSNSHILGTFSIVAFQGLNAIKLFSCSTKLSMKFILLINVKMPTIIGILTFISRINTASEDFKTRKILLFHKFIFMST